MRSVSHSEIASAVRLPHWSHVRARSTKSPIMVCSEWAECVDVLAVSNSSVSFTQQRKGAVADAYWRQT